MCPSCSQNRGGMEPDDLLCSRNARPKKALVGRAQWKINQPPSLKREQASLEGACISFDARSKGQPWPLLQREVSRIGRPSLGLMARLGVPVGGRVRKLRAVGDQSGHPL
jgi:hypothetical protein